MRWLVTGSSGHLGEALMRMLRQAGEHVVGIDRLPSEFTDRVGNITDREFVQPLLSGVDAVLHTATLHKPHVATHRRQEFVDTNVTGTLNLLEAAVAARVRTFVFTSTTSVYGDALVPAIEQPAAWITETVAPIPKNIYGVTKSAAEDLCQLFHRNEQLPCVILRTSRFFPEADDDPNQASLYTDQNLKLNELLFRRVDIADVVDAHLLAAERGPTLGFGKFILSATTPFQPGDLIELRTHAASVVAKRIPDAADFYAARGWRLPQRIDRVYVNEQARHQLGWQPKYDFQSQLRQFQASGDIRSPLARVIGCKGYHAR